MKTFFKMQFNNADTGTNMEVAHDISYRYYVQRGSYRSTTCTSEIKQQKKLRISFYCLIHMFYFHIFNKCRTGFQLLATVTVPNPDSLKCLYSVQRYAVFYYRTDQDILFFLCKLLLHLLLQLCCLLPSQRPEEEYCITQKLVFVYPNYAMGPIEDTPPPQRSLVSCKNLQPVLNEEVHFENICLGSG